MKHNLSVSSRIVILSLFASLFALLFSLANVIYNDYQHNLKVKEFEAENERYREENKVKMYEYLRSQLRLVLEKEKKETLNQVNPDEEVIVIHEGDDKEDMFEQPEKEKVMKTRREERYKSMTNLEKWYYFFFD